MAEYEDREHHIPLRRQDLVDLLDGQLPSGDRESFQSLCRLLSAIFHFEYHDRLETIKNSYAHFDPDADAKALEPLNEMERVSRLDHLEDDVRHIMEKANYHELSIREIEEATQSNSHWGINMDVDFSAFDRLHLFARGDMLGKRTRKSMWTLWRPQELDVPIYQRLVLMLKLKPHPRLKNVDTDDVYLKLFKDIPKMDLEMLLPGSRLRMPILARGKLGLSLASTVGMILWKVAQDVAMITNQMVQRNPMALWGPLSLVCGYGYKQFHGYNTTKQSYSLQLTRSLYYQNLDNNAGVITRLLDEAEEQESREAILGYYYLWQKAGRDGWTTAELDDHVEAELERCAGIQVDFEIDDALHKLVRLGVVDEVDGRYRAKPIRDALVQLDRTWDNYFEYHQPEPTILRRAG